MNYKTNPQGRITDPGKFEGERRYVPHFWDLDAEVDKLIRSR